MHVYRGGDYALDDVTREFQLGNSEREQGYTVLQMDMGELRRLNACADAYSFDFDEEFIEMCKALYQYAIDLGAARCRFIANFE